jgi:hypothetical protein
MIVWVFLKAVKKDRFTLQSGKTALHCSQERPLYIAVKKDRFTLRSRKTALLNPLARLLQFCHLYYFIFAD